MNQRYVVIVDPYSSAVFFPLKIQAQGYQCIAVHTTEPSSVGLSASFQPEDFAASLIYRGDIQETILALQQYDVIAIMPGIETGVLLADDLAEALNLPRNDYALSLSRRNKLKMQKAIANAGLRAIRSFETDDVEKAIAWANQQAIWPVVIKPIESGGSDNVRRCDNEVGFRSAFSQILGTNNFFGIPNQTVLIQEFLTGVEYVVDAVSASGHHYTTNLVKYHKEIYNGSIIYDTLEFLPPSGDIARVLTQYNDAVLDALGIILGPSHSEIMLTATGPVLIEVGARINGGKVGPLVVQECAEHSLINLAVESYLNPEFFKFGTPPQNIFNKNAAGLCFRNEKKGLIKSIPGLEELNSLASLFHLELFVRPGQTVVPTHDLYTSPAWIVLVHEKQEQLEKDFNRVKHLNMQQQLLEIA